MITVKNLLMKFGTRGLGNTLDNGKQSLSHKVWKSLGFELTQSVGSITSQIFHFCFGSLSKNIKMIAKAMKKWIDHVKEAVWKNLLMNYYHREMTYFGQ